MKKLIAVVLSVVVLVACSSNKVVTSNKDREERFITKLGMFRSDVIDYNYSQARAGEPNDQMYWEIPPDKDGLNGCVYGGSNNAKVSELTCDGLIQSN